MSPAKQCGCHVGIAQDLIGIQQTAWPSLAKPTRTSRDVQGQYRTTVQQVASLNKKQMSTNDAQIR